jgi:hypothetical protein
MSDVEDARFRAYGLLSATFVATLGVAAVEVARVPAATYGAQPGLVLGVLALTVQGAVMRFAPAIGAFVLVALVAALAPRVSWIARGAVALRLMAAAFVSFSLYRLLVRYEPFAEVAIVKVAFAVLVPVVAWGLHEGSRSAAHVERGRRIAPRLVVAFALGAVACLALDARFLPGAYPTLHLCLLGLSHVMLAVGLGLVPRFFRPNVRPLRALALTTAVLVVGLALAPSSLSKAAQPTFRSYTDIGRASGVFEP